MKIRGIKNGAMHTYVVETELHGTEIYMFIVDPDEDMRQDITDQLPTERYPDSGYMVGWNQWKLDLPKGFINPDTAGLREFWNRELRRYQEEILDSMDLTRVEWTYPTMDYEPTLNNRDQFSGVEYWALEALTDESMKQKCTFVRSY